MAYNLPDRVKLISVYVILNVIIGMFITITLVSLDFSESYLPSFLQAYICGYLLSVLITLPIFSYYWKQLRRQEEAGDLPDMNDMRNLTPLQMIFLALALPLFLTGYVLLQFGYTSISVLCYACYFVIWGIETVYVRRRFKRIKDEKSNS
jgi:hypothetical protein